MLCKVQVCDISFSSFVCWWCHSILKATALVKHNLPLVKPCWLFQITSLSHMCLSNSSRASAPQSFQTQTWGSSFRESSFLHSLKMWYFPFSWQWRHHMAAMTFQRWLRAAWQPYESVNSGSWGVHLLVPWTYACLFTSGSFRLVSSFTVEVITLPQLPPRGSGI